MDTINLLAKKLLGFIELENEKTREEISGYIVGELIGDYEGLYAELLDTNDTIRRIADAASDLEWSNGHTDELDAMWVELKRLVRGLGGDN